MLEKDKYLELHSKFYDLLDSETKWVDNLLDHNDYKVSSELVSGPEWMIFHMLLDHIGTLVNRINTFCTRGRRLSVWTKMLEEIKDDEEKINLVAEVLEPSFIVAINSPYSLQSKLIFLSCLLLRKTAEFLCEPVKNFKEKDINLKTLKEFEELANRQGWSSYNVFIEKLEKINSKDFKEKTQDYRSRSHHRLEPYLEIGLLPSIPRERITKILNERGEEEQVTGVSYGFGYEHPIVVSTVMPLLYLELQSCIEAFKAFWDLINDLVLVHQSK